MSMYVGPETKGKVLLIDLAQFGRWTQYPAADDPGEDKFVVDTILVRVKDLRRHAKLREQIIRKDPEWLRGEADKVRYLSGRVVVNVYEKFEIEVADPDAAIAFDITNVD